MHIKFMVIIETLEITEEYTKETRKGFDNDVGLIQQPIVNSILWIHKKWFINLKMFNIGTCQR